VPTTPRATGFLNWAGAPVSVLGRSMLLRRYALGMVGAVLAGALVTIGPAPLRLGTTAQASATYSQSVLADSPAVYYRLGEGSGTTAADSSGNGRNGAYLSGAQLGIAGATGDGDTAINVNNATAVQYQAGTGVPIGNSARTVEFWTSLTSGGSMRISYGSQSTKQAFGIAVLSDTVYVSAYGYDIPIPTPFKIEDGAWHLYDITFDGTYAATYLDGLPMGTVNYGSINTVNDPNVGLVLGNCSSQSCPSTGSLDEVAIYPSALTSSRVAAHYSASGRSAAASPTSSSTYENSVKADSPNIYYRLDEAASATSAVDDSGNGRPASYATAPTYAADAPGALLTNPNGAASSSNHSIAQYLGGTGLPTGNAPRTVEAWVKTTSSSRQGLGVYGSSTQDQSFGLFITGSTVYISGWSDDHQLSAPYALDDNHWHHVVATYDGSVTTTLYLDSQRLGTTTFGAQLNTVVSGVGLMLGDGLVGGGALTGALDEVAIYGTALSADRVRAHYMASGRTAPISPPVTAQNAPTGAPRCQTCATARITVGGVTKYPINTQSGNFYHSFADISIPGRSTPLALTRTYNSQNAGTNGAFGYGWQFNHNMSLACSGTTATITQEDSGTVSFTTTGSCASGTWAPSATWAIASLVHNGDGSWTFKRQARDTYAFNSSGQLTTATDINGYATTLTYTGGNLTTITDPASRTLTVGWTGSHITTLTDANVSGNTRTVTYAYNGNGELSDVTDVNGGVTHFGYDTSHRVTLMKDPVCQALGVSCPGVQNHYDGSGRTDWQKDQLNRQTTLAYAGTPTAESGGTTTSTDPKGNVTVEGYQYGVRTYITRGYGTAAAATTRYLYDSATLGPRAVIDPNGNTTTFTVDSSGNILTKTDPLGRVTTATYNALNEPLTVQDGKGVTTTLTYDTYGNPLTSSTPVTGTSCPCQVTTYNRTDATHPGDVTSMVDGDSKTWSYGYDSNGYPVETKDPLGNVSASVRNNDGWPTAIYSPKAGCTWGSVPPAGCSATYKTTPSYVNPVTLATNEFGDVQTVTDPLGHVNTYGYDAERQRTSVKDGKGNVTTTVYDVANQPTQVKRADTPQTTLTTDYNADGTVLDQKDGTGTATQTYGYDSLGWPTTVTDALGQVTTASYDGAGNPLAKQDPGGNCGATPKVGCTTMAYDAANQLTAITYSDGTTPNVSSIQYDADGQRTGMTDGTGTSSWSWDSLHRLTQHTNGGGGQVQYAYNLRNLPTQITYPGTIGSVTRGYDNAGRWTSVADWNGNTTSFGYDANSNLTTETLPTTTGVVDTMAFDTADNLTSITDTKAPLTLFSSTVVRDSNNQLSSDSSQPTTTGSFQYSALNQLCYAGSSSTSACSSPPVGSTAYGFDAADNLTQNGTTQQRFNAANQLCWTAATAGSCASPPTGATTYTYDARGNRTAVTPAAGSATALGYDQANRLTSWAQGTASATYAYDGGGLRTSKTVGGSTTAFTWDSSGGLALLLQEGSTKYVYGPGGLPLEQVTGTTTQYLHHDQLGSTRLITDSSGLSVGTYTYEPYGAVTAHTGTATTNLQYAGQYTDPESGLQYLRARYYDPSTGQFVSRDPMVAKTMSPYSYVSGNPLNATDPSGLAQIDYWGANCVWIPFTDHSGCDTHLSPQQGAGGVAVAGAVGVCVAGGCEAAATAIAATRVGSACIGAAGALGRFFTRDPQAEDVSADSTEMAGIMAQGSRVIAGPGSNSALRDAPRLAAQYGGQQSQWAKMTSTAYKVDPDTGAKLQVHWYENLTTGQIEERKWSP